MTDGFYNRQRRYAQYRSILFQRPQHRKALQECLKEGGLNTYDQSFLYVFAPTAVEFLKWVLAEVVKDNKKRLYFLARDGWLFYHAAQLLAAGYGYDLELRYLKVSRYSMRTACYDQMGGDCIDLICSDGIGVTFEKIMKRAALTEEESFRIAALTGFSGNEKNSLSSRQIVQLKKRLRQTPLFLEYVFAHSIECRNAAESYLKQEGLTESVSYGIVDSGWIGTLQQSIEQLVNRPVYGYYFGLYEIPRNADILRYKAFYFMPGTKIRRKIFFSNCLFETVFSAPEGMTIGYTHGGVKGKEPQYQPIESEMKNPNGRRILRNKTLLMKYAAAYVKDIPMEKHIPIRSESGGKLAEKLCPLLMGKPALFEAESFGSQLFCDDVLEHTMQPVAAEITYEDLKKQGICRRILGKAGFFQKEPKKSAWPEASITLCGRSVRKYLLQERIYKYLIYLRKAFTAR